MSVVLGLLACAVSSFCFSSMYVWLRKFEISDGIFAQWIVCSSIYSVGIIIFGVTGFQFQPFAMIGGVLWAIGNLTALPIINAIGLGMGVLVWGSTNCVLGWAVSRFGLLGLHANIPSYPILNYFGVVFVLIGGILISFIKPTVKHHPENVQTTVPSLISTETNQETVESNLIPENDINIQPQNEGPPLNRLQAKKVKIGAIIFSALAGICYGLTFVPVIYIQENPEKFINPPKDAVDYAFSHYTGIYAASTSVLLIYLVYKQNTPFVNSKAILPAFFAGLNWSIAQLAWFFANDVLSQSISFPINSMVPGVCATLWSVLYFKEIEGKQNLRLLVGAIIITLFGAGLVGFSK